MEGSWDLHWLPEQAVLLRFRRCRTRFLRGSSLSGFRGCSCCQEWVSGQAYKQKQSQKAQHRLQDAMSSLIDCLHRQSLLLKDGLRACDFGAACHLISKKSQKQSAIEELI